MNPIKKRFSFKTFIIILSFFTSGCASPYLLFKQTPTLALQPNEGAVLFSSKFNNKERPDQKNTFWVTNIALQEVNQYKSYGEKQLFFIPYPKVNYIQQDDLFLFSLKLPRGIYRITSFNGMFRTFFATEYSAAVNKIFDVVPGKISYAGRVETVFFISGGQQTHEIKIEDKFDEDQGRFKNGYPALQNRTIVKDLIY
ncbi:MAG: hypothetical protein KKG43_04205 [Candidatus Omnitrophica bacterium]|nr:hypothetical protein [Candidatus Omnitrophota bacterium]MBU2035238.1 hypothetical protein [Candidatus Omnitrophota bacterium]MBU2257593.1 hypothetical protein [Candidatus Omnitrophota bacterium]